MRTLPLAILILALATPLAHAATADDPEVTDPAGDCSFPPGNAYMDIVSAWVSDETATDFLVHIALSQWTPAVAEGAGFTLQFTHQKVQFGVLAGYIAQTWSYGNGQVDGKAITFNETNGSFQESPPVLSIQFHKSNFPHADPNDLQLVDFTGGSIDLKPLEPFFFVPTTLPAYPDALACDSVTGSKPYTFQNGHASHMAMASALTNETAPTPSSASESTPASTTPPSAPSQVPGAGVLLVAVGLLVAVFLRRR